MKPQYEAGRARVGRGGIVRDPEVHAAVLREVVAGLDDAGLGVCAVMPSPLRGADGNVEFVVHARRGPATVIDRTRSTTRCAAPRMRRDARPRPARVGLVPHRDRPLAHELAQRTAAWLVEHDVEVRVPEALAPAAGLEEYGVEPDDFAPDLDLVISLGGDGTMLHTVQLVYPAPVPIVGVNVGQLGYLSDLEPDELDASLPRLVAGDFEVSERMMLAVDVESAGAVRGSWYALNEAVIEKLRTGHLIYLDVSINGTPFTSYAADGLIVATPTGSTAYSFSAGGPIVSPDLRCIVLTPISPHMLFDRSLVLSEHEELEFDVSDGRNVALTIDGRELGELCSGDRVRCRVAPEPLRLVEPPAARLPPDPEDEVLACRTGDDACSRNCASRTSGSSPSCR